MNKRMFLSGTVFLAVIFTPFVLFGEETASTPVNDLLKEALANNPQIQQARHRWQAAASKVNNVKGLPNPQVSYGYFGESIETRVGPQEQKFGVSQMVPFPGKLGLKGKIQDKEAQILQERYEEVKSDVINDVKTAYYDLFWVRKALEINQEEKDVLEDLEKVAQRKYESNLLPQQNVVKLQVELSKIIQRIALFEQNEKTVRTKINRLLDRQVDLPVETETEITIEPFTLSLEDVIKISKDSRQGLLAAGLSVEKSEFEKSLAKKDYLPDFTVGYEYTQIGSGTTLSVDDGQDAWMGKISVSVPLWFRSIKSGVESKELELEAAKENLKNSQRLADFEVQDMYYKIKTAEEIVSLYETALVPQARQAFEASQTGFETGKITFIDWLDTERTYLQTRLAYYKAIADQQKSVAALERTVGTQLGGYHEQ